MDKVDTKYTLHRWRTRRHLIGFRSWSCCWSWWRSSCVVCEFFVGQVSRKRAGFDPARTGHIKWIPGSLLNWRDHSIDPVIPPVCEGFVVWISEFSQTRVSEHGPQGNESARPTRAKTYQVFSISEQNQSSIWSFSEVNLYKKMFWLSLHVAWKNMVWPGPD